MRGQECLPARGRPAVDGDLNQSFFDLVDRYAGATPRVAPSRFRNGSLLLHPLQELARLPEDIAQIQSQRVHSARSAALLWAVSDVATVEAPDAPPGAAP